MNILTIIKFSLVCSFILLTPKVSVAQAIIFDKSASINIFAKELEIYTDKNIAYLRGGVDIKQSTLSIKADNIELKYNENIKSKIETAKADGNVVLQDAGKEVTATRADYNFTSGQVVLTGDVKMKYKDNSNEVTHTMQGERLIYNLVNKKVSLK